jgi:hypothetical protein
MRVLYFLIVVLLSVIDALLISKPNFLGKLGLWLFKYSYLRTFPRALITVSLVVGIAVLISEVFVFIARRKVISKVLGFILLILLLLVSGGVLFKVVHDFSKGVYSHTGAYFRYGVFLLPSILVFVFTTSLIRLVNKKT